MLDPTDATAHDPLLLDDADRPERGSPRRSYHSSHPSPPLRKPDTSSPSSPSQRPIANLTPFDEQNLDKPLTMPPPGRRRSISPPPTGRSTTTLLRTRSPPPTTAAALAAARADARRRYTIAAFFLLTSLVSFTVQTELAAYIQHDLAWDKAYCMLWLTHSSWVLLWPLQLAVLWLLRGGGRRRGREGTSWGRFWKGHVRLVRRLAVTVETRDLKAGGVGGGGGGGGLEGYGHPPWRYLARTTVVVTSALTVAGLSWYLAVSMTSPSDLTAIYNCSAFFAYAFSVPLLKERLRLDKMVAVAVAIVGVLVVAYGDNDFTQYVKHGGSVHVEEPSSRLAGNLIIGAGSVLYGLYEVLYKRYACPPDGTDAAHGVIFANTFGSLIGAFTLCVLWIPLPILHVLGWERFELPTGRPAWLLFVSVVMNMVFSGSFLVLISLTSPVLSSVAALLTIFIVAVVDWWLTSVPLTPASIIGGLLIIAAFAMLSWSTWREMSEAENRKMVDFSGDEDD